MTKESDSKNEPTEIGGEDILGTFRVEHLRPLGHIFKPVIFPTFSESEKAHAHQLAAIGTTPELITKLYSLGMLNFQVVITRVFDFIQTDEEFEFLGREASTEMYQHLNACLSSVMRLAYKVFSPLEGIDHPYRGDLQQLFLQAVFLGSIIGKVNVEELLQRAYENAGQKVGAGIIGGQKRADTSKVRAAAYKAAFDAAANRGFKRTTGDLRKFLGSLAPQRFKTNVIGCEEVWLGDEKKFTDTIGVAADSTVIGYRDNG